MKQLTLAVLAAFAIAGTCSAAVKDGTYTKTVTGHNAPITVTVDIKGGKIASIATKDLESPGVGKVAIKKLEDSVIKNQSTNIDIVSGASVTSFQLLGAIKDCLKQAGAKRAISTSALQTLTRLPSQNVLTSLSSEAAEQV